MLLLYRRKSGLDRTRQAQGNDTHKSQNQETFQHGKGLNPQQFDLCFVLHGILCKPWLAQL